MTPITRQSSAPMIQATADPLRVLGIGVLAFLTVVDLFATQAILPALTLAYATTPAVMSLAVNAATVGMMIAGLLMALFGRFLPRRHGVVCALALLALPTLALSLMPDLGWFAALRVSQGLCMAAAFSLTLAHIAEDRALAGAAIAFAAYITGNVASNLFGRLLSAALADHFGIAFSFVVFATLNLCGCALALMTFGLTPRNPRAVEPMPTPAATWAGDPGRSVPWAAFALGFCILFVFIGVFTYVNFVLAAPPFRLDMMALGSIYLVFLPSVLTTPLAGDLARRFGARRVTTGALLLAMLGLPPLLVRWLPAVLAGLVLISVGTFLAQAVVTGFVGRAARGDQTTASGFYLGCYYMGGLAGSLILGVVFDRSGWSSVVGVIGSTLLAAILLSRHLRER